jgi:N-succinyldiaminopimelate aminotransferase
MSPMVQRASAAAWSDEAHVVANRELYRQKFAQVMPVLQDVVDVQLPDAAFYLWAALPGNATQVVPDEVAWAQGLLAQYNVNVLPGSLLARSVAHHTPSNPGTGRVRMALVAPVAECLEAAHRIAAYCRQNRPNPQQD